MPLTPEDVHKKTFTPVRLREGYDMGEVDRFLDEVEVELTRLRQENDDLRAKLATASTSGPAGQVAPSPQAAPTPEPVRAAQPDRAPEQPTPAVTALPAVQTVREASSAAARLLEIAAQNADQLVNEAQGDADRILGECRVKTERLEADSKAKSERVESDARTRAEKLDVETSERRQQLFGQLEHRSRLRGYFQSQLKALDGEGDGDAPLTPSADGETPRRLRELLGEDQQQEH
jgi:DivIVA domain-containing protein